MKQRPAAPKVMSIAIFLVVILGFALLELSAEVDHRILRGGSYSNGGSSSHSSWSSGGSHYNNNGRNSNYYNNGNGIGFAGFILALMFFCFIVPGLCMAAFVCFPCLSALCCGTGLGAAAMTNFNKNDHDHFNYQNNLNHTSNNPMFDQAVQRAKDEIRRQSSTTSFQSQPQAQPYSGQYTTSFVDPDSKVSHNASLCLFFTPTNGGFQIAGQGSDIDGNTVVEEGFATYDGAAWWRERTISGDVGLEVLSRGTFHYPSQTFQGTWMASTMVTGPYASFAALNSQPVAMEEMNYPSNCAPLVTGEIVTPKPIKETKYPASDVPLVQGEIVS
mmetsp:Transcript_1557/g.2134  ORF Transcript_1557/g.2134 Transcript_1557/m.2134 type:complete len:331 (-) Transcript_1557:367-1359(-)